MKGYQLLETIGIGMVVIGVLVWLTSKLIEDAVLPDAPHQFKIFEDREDMAMGIIKAIDSRKKLKENEVLFEVGEKIELKGSWFKVTGVSPSPTNEIILKGYPNYKSQ